MLVFVPSLLPTVSTLCTDPDLVEKMKNFVLSQIYQKRWDLT